MVQNVVKYKSKHQLYYQPSFEKSKCAVEKVANVHKMTFRK